MCTSFTITSSNGDVVYGRTMEFTLPMRPQVMIVPEGVTLTATGIAGDIGVGGRTWRTTHASVGMSGLGMDVILDGINDAGLIVACFNFPVSAKFVAVTEDQQSTAVACHEIPNFLLTTCADVTEVRTALAEVPVHGPTIAAYGGQVPKIHFTVHDAAGASIVAEWTDGELHIYDNPTTVLTNEPPFPAQLDNLAQYTYLTAAPAPAITLPGLTLKAPSSGGGMHALPGGFLATNRFVRAFWAARSVPAFATPDEGISHARHIVNGFDIPPGSVITPAGEGESGGTAGWEMTQWSSMADCTNRVYYVNTLDHQGWTKVDLAAISDELAEVTTIDLPAHDRFHELTR